MNLNNYITFLVKGENQLIEELGLLFFHSYWFGLEGDYFTFNKRDRVSFLFF
jgi:hypothetical protein